MNRASDTPFFSIVTPAFNAAPYIEALIDCVAAQTADSWEMIIIDDGSTDQTLCKARLAIERSPFPDRFILDSMPAASGSDFLPRARAMRMARGAYVVNIDADDIVGHDYLEQLARRIKDTDADIVYARMWRMSQHDVCTPFLPTDKYVSRHGMSRVITGKKMMRHSLGSWEVTGVGATRRTLALRSLHEFDSLMRSPAHIDSFDNENLSRLDLHLADRVTFCDKAIYRYRITAGSVTEKISVRSFHLLGADASLCAFIARSYGLRSKEHILAQTQLFHHIFDAMRMTNKSPELADDPTVKSLTDQARSALDRPLLKSHVSPRYLALSLLPVGMARRILAIYDRLSAGKQK